MVVVSVEIVHMRDTEPLKTIVNGSGFPLQLALEHAITENKSVHGWNVYSREHAWKNETTGKSGFIDIVLRDTCRTSVMIIECKRVQDSDWIFLNPKNSANYRRHAKTWITNIFHNSRVCFEWADVALEPSTPESQFCIVPGQDNKSKPMLERTAAELVEATEGFASEDYKVLINENIDLRLYFNIIVTTAHIKVCDFDASEISIESGIIDNVSFRDVPYLRFCKQLSPNREISRFDRYSPFKQKENTVFVVNSKSFIDFLSDFKPDNSSFDQVLKSMRYRSFSEKD